MPEPTAALVFKASPLLPPANANEEAEDEPPADDGDELAQAEPEDQDTSLHPGDILNEKEQEKVMAMEAKHLKETMANPYNQANLKVIQEDGAIWKAPPVGMVGSEQADDISNLRHSVPVVSTRGEAGTRILVPIETPDLDRPPTDPRRTRHHQRTTQAPS